jgi:hypothetical protein
MYIRNEALCHGQLWRNLGNAQARNGVYTRVE